MDDFGAVLCWAALVAAVCLSVPACVWALTQPPHPPWSLWYDRTTWW